MTRKSLGQLELPRDYRLWIAGEWRAAASGSVFERVSPADGRLVGRYADAGLPDVESAIATARREFDSGTWRRASAHERSSVLSNAATIARDRRDVIASIAAWEVGKPLAQTSAEVSQFIAALEFCAGAVLSMPAQESVQHGESGIAMVVREPMGVVAAITSYNFPINLVAAKVPYALAAGCSVVLKPSELSTGTAVEVCRVLLDAGLPPHALQVVSTTSVDVARQLVSSPLVDKVAFTGSTVTGRTVMRDAADTIKRLTLELGGKGAFVVFDDADLDAVESAIFGSIFQSAGQVCTAGSRLLVHEAVHEDVARRAARVAEGVRVGHPLDPETTMGPVATADLLERITRYVEEAVGEGAQLLAGGKRIDVESCAGGWHYAPTVLDDVDPRSRLAQEEIFGPVLAITPFSTEAEAIEIANGTDYGLKSTVWTRDGERLLRVLRSLQAGIVMGNTAAATVPQVGMPFGGYKMSGLGREYGMEGLVSFMETKSMFIKL